MSLLRQIGQRQHLQFTLTQQMPQVYPFQMLHVHMTCNVMLQMPSSWITRHLAYGTPRQTEVANPLLRVVISPTWYLMVGKLHCMQSGIKTWSHARQDIISTTEQEPNVNWVNTAQAQVKSTKVPRAVLKLVRRVVRQSNQVKQPLPSVAR